jgi:hypothetical protein
MKKKIIITVCALILLGAAIFAAIHFIDIKTPEEYYSEDDKEKENVIGSVTISIRCDRVIGMAEHIPSDGIILDAATFDIEEGDTVYSILIEAAKKYKLQIDQNTSGTMTYVSGINNIGEMDFGDVSGWTYTVNGEVATVGASEYVLSDGDVIEWKYALTLEDYFG